MRKIELLREWGGIRAGDVAFVSDDSEVDEDGVLSGWYLDNALCGDSSASDFWLDPKGEGTMFRLLASEPAKQPDNNPKTRAGGMNKAPLHLVPVSGIIEEALSFADGGFKYGPFNFTKEPISASVYAGAMMRHFILWYYGGQDFASDSNAHHLGALRASANMVLDGTHRGTINDNRPPPVDVEALLARLESVLPELRARDTTKFDLHDIPEHEHD